MIKYLFILLFPFVSQGQVINSSPLYFPVSGFTPINDTVAVNFYGAISGVQVPTANWNNVVSATPAATGSSLVYLSNGSNSGLSISLPMVLSSNWADNGTICTSSSDNFPALAHNNAMYNTTTPITITILGCDDARTYDILWLGSRASATHMLTIAKGAQSSSWEAGNPNCTARGYLTALTSTAGTLTFTLAYTTGGFSYSNACKIVVH